VKDAFLLYTAKSMIERDVLLSLLNENLIDTKSPARDMSRKYTENTVDLSLGGYSVFFDGFKVYVAGDQVPKAKIALAKFLNEKKSHEVIKSDEASSYLKKFYFFGISAVFIPFIPAIFGLYYLLKGLKAGERLRPIYFVVCIMCYSVSLLSTLALIEQVKKFLE
jgi:hypothetical protein